MALRNTMYDHGGKPSKDTYLTPDLELSIVKDVMYGKGLFLDPCPGPLPHRIKHIGGQCLAPESDGLKVCWRHFSDFSFVNPPFSAMEDWIDKVIDETSLGHTSLWFTKLDFRTSWGRLLVEEGNLLAITKGYVKYLDANGKKQGSATFQTGWVAFGSNSAVIDLKARLIISKYAQERLHHV